MISGEPRCPKSLKSLFRPFFFGVFAVFPCVLTDSAVFYTAFHCRGLFYRKNGENPEKKTVETAILGIWDICAFRDLGHLGSPENHIRLSSKVKNTVKKR